MFKLFPFFLLILLGGCATTPPWEKTDPDQQAQAYANRGMGYLEFDQPIRAMQDFQLALDLRPRHARALHGMALSLQEQGETNWQKTTLRKRYRQPHIKLLPETTMPLFYSAKAVMMKHELN